MQSNFSKEQPVQDESDGLLFFHTHSVWEAVAKLEKFYECTIYGVLELQEVEENIQYYGADEQKFSKKLRPSTENCIQSKNTLSKSKIRAKTICNGK